MNKYNVLKNKIKERYPNAKIKYKSKHWFWKRLPKAFRLSAITFPSTIWMPEENDDFDMLAHEYQHLVDFEDMGYVNAMLMYLSPQIYSLFWFLFAIMAFGFSLNIFGIILLITGICFLLPWPSKGRVFFETRGYTMSLYAASLQRKDMYRYSNFVIDALGSWLYYKMIWSRDETVNIIFDAQDSINNSTSIKNTSVAFEDVHEIIQAEK